MGGITRHFDPKRRPGDTEILARAIADRVARVPLPNRALLQRLFRYRSFRDLEPPTPSELNDPAVQDRTAQQVEHMWPEYTQSPWPAGQFVELSRIVVPFRQSLVLKKLETFERPAPPNGTTTPTTKDAWADPFTFEAISWVLRISSLGQRMATRVIGFGNDQVPGVPFTDLSRWSDMRYPWGNNENVHIPVPGGHVVRLFAYVNTTTAGITGAAGRLVGVMQGSQHVSTAWNTRRGFRL